MPRAVTATPRKQSSPAAVDVAAVADAAVAADAAATVAPAAAADMAAAVAAEAEAAARPSAVLVAPAAAEVAARATDSISFNVNHKPTSSHDLGFLFFTTTLPKLSAELAHCLAPPTIAPPALPNDPSGAAEINA